jgi:DNA-binding PadR family transcriptional regulator
MRVDLQPLIAELWESCANVTKYITTPDKDFVTFRNDPPTNVHAVYAGSGKYADASMRTLYKFAIKRSGYTTVLARSLTASALTTLDYLGRNGEATRAELVAGAGMSPGAAAGGTRVLEQLGLVSVEWDGPGTAKIYILHPDWESRLQAIIPHMTSYGAGIRLRIRTFDDRIEFVNWKLRIEKSLPAIRELNERKRKLERERRKWRAYGNQIGAFGRYVETTPPWQGVGQ